MRTRPFIVVAAIALAGCGSSSSDYPVVVGNANVNPIAVFATGGKLGEVAAGETASFVLRLQDTGYFTADFTGNPGSPSPATQATFSARDLSTGTLACFNASGIAQGEPCKPTTLTHEATYVQFRRTDFCSQLSTGALPPCESPPVSAFVFSPTAPSAGSTVVFNGAASQAGAGRAIVQYIWNFGDPAKPAPGAGVTATHVFDAAGTYSVTLTIVDDQAERATTAQTVMVAAPPAAQ